MSDVIYQVVLPIITAATAWFFSKLKTNRENKQTDLQLINEAISPLLKSIAELTQHVSTTTAELVEEKKLTLQLVEEKSALLAEIEGLNTKVTNLEKKIQSLANLIKKQRKNESETTDNITT